MPPEPVLRRHADHDPSVICRPAFGRGLCEVLEPRKPVKLTFPSYDIGAARIMAGDLQVGTVLGEYRGWCARLWPAADDFKGQLGAEQVRRARLADLRAELRERVELKGAWWSG